MGATSPRRSGSSASGCCLTSEADRDRRPPISSSTGAILALRMDGGTFELFDLRVVVEEIRGRCTCQHAVGDQFELRGGKLSLPAGQSFCLYALQSAIPLLPAKQRQLDRNDWMATDSRVVCPDPLCGLVMRIDRIDRRRLQHDDVSATPLTADKIVPPEERRRES